MENNEQFSSGSDESQDQIQEEQGAQEALEHSLDEATEAVASGEASEDEAVQGLLSDIDSGDLEMTQEEHDALMQDATGTEVTGTELKDETTGSSEPKSPPAYQAFIAAVQAHVTALGLDLQVKEQKGFFQFGSSSTGHRLYVAKQGRGVTRVDTTLPRTALTVNGRDISIPLTKPNGRVACHIDPSVESVAAALEVLASFEHKIGAPRKPASKAA